MMSFELFRLLKVKKSISYVHFSTFFLLKYIIGDKLHHFMRKKVKYFASNYGIITALKIKLCKKSFLSFMVILISLYICFCFFGFFYFLFILK